MIVKRIPWTGTGESDAARRNAPARDIPCIPAGDKNIAACDDLSLKGPRPVEHPFRAGNEKPGMAPSWDRLIQFGIIATVGGLIGLGIVLLIWRLF